MRRKATHTLAIAHEDSKNVTVWATDIGHCAEGRKFDAINGGWSGVITSDGFVIVEGNVADKRRGRIAWEGIVPEKFSRDYNLAMDWIEQIAMS
jgi:hypothetical protein